MLLLSLSFVLPLFDVSSTSRFEQLDNVIDDGVGIPLFFVTVLFEEGIEECCRHGARVLVQLYEIELLGECWIDVDRMLRLTSRLESSMRVVKSSVLVVEILQTLVMLREKWIASGRESRWRTERFFHC